MPKGILIGKLEWWMNLLFADDHYNFDGSWYCNCNHEIFQSTFFCPPHKHKSTALLLSLLCFTDKRRQQHTHTGSWHKLALDFTSQLTYSHMREYHPDPLLCPTTVSKAQCCSMVETTDIYRSRLLIMEKINSWSVGNVNQKIGSWPLSNLLT